MGIIRNVSVLFYTITACTIYTRSTSDLNYVKVCLTLAIDLYSFWYNYQVNFACSLLQTNTFQCVLASDGMLSFVIFLYADGEIQWTKGDASSTTAQVGVNAGDGNQSESVPGSLTEEIINITLTSNVGIPGMWIFEASASAESG